MKKQIVESNIIVWVFFFFFILVPKKWGLLKLNILCIVGLICMFILYSGKSGMQGGFRKYFLSYLTSQSKCLK